MASTFELSIVCDGYDALIDFCYGPLDPALLMPYATHVQIKLDPSIPSDKATARQHEAELSQACRKLTQCLLPNLTLRLRTFSLVPHQATRLPSDYSVFLYFITKVDACFQGQEWTVSEELGGARWARGMTEPLIPSAAAVSHLKSSARTLIILSRFLILWMKNIESIDRGVRK